MTDSRDITNFLDRLPSGRAPACGLLRLSLVVIVTNALWRETALAQIVHHICTAATEKILNAAQSAVRFNVLSGMRSEFLYNLFVPLMCFAFLPLRKFGPTLAKVMLGTAFVALLDLLIAILRVKWVYAVLEAHDREYYTDHAKPLEEIVIMTISYSVVPLLSAILASVLVDRFIRARAQRREVNEQYARKDLPKVGRNEPCPCGSELKYKRCCGSGAR